GARRRARAQQPDERAGRARHGRRCPSPQRCEPRGGQHRRRRQHGSRYRAGHAVLRLGLAGRGRDARVRRDPGLRGRSERGAQGGGRLRPRAHSALPREARLGAGRRFRARLMQAGCWPWQIPCRPRQPAGDRTMPSSTPKDACHLLDSDHRAVKKMFKEYEELTSSKARDARERKMDLAREICLQLTVHAQIEEEIFYPALREAMRETELLDEAEVEHQTAKDLIAQIEAMEDSEEIIDAKV